MIRLVKWRTWALMLCIPLSMIARAEDTPTPAPTAAASPAASTLDQCIAAASTARPGAVTGWQELSDNAADGYYVRIVDKDGSIWLTECRPTSKAPLEFNKKTGLIRYQNYERIKVTEPAARAVAPAVFAPPVRITRMEVAISMMGSPYYKYTLLLPGGHQGYVEVDAVNGKPITAKVDYAKGG